MAAGLICVPWLGEREDQAVRALGLDYGDENEREKRGKREGKGRDLLFYITQQENLAIFWIRVGHDDDVCCRSSATIFRCRVLTFLRFSLCLRAIFSNIVKFGWNWSLKQTWRWSLDIRRANLGTAKCVR